MTDTTHTPRMQSRKWGLTPEQLAEHPTSYRPDLFAGQNFLISGAGSGMGRATAYLVARLGANVMICGRNEEKIASVAADIKGVAVTCNVPVPASSR